MNNPIIRLVVGVPVAALITAGLYLLMNTLILPKGVELGENQFRTLENITPQEQETEVRRSERKQVRRLQTSDKPPPPPKLTTSKSQVNLPTPQIQGAAPTEVKFERVASLSFDAVAVSDRDAQPIRPPVVSYPRRAQERGTEGTCEVRFDVDTRGKPYNVTPVCSDSVFQREAKRAVEGVEFAPKIVRGKPVERRNVVYPIEFKLG